MSFRIGEFTWSSCLLFRLCLVSPLRPRYMQCSTRILAWSSPKIIMVICHWCHFSPVSPDILFCNFVSTSVIFFQLLNRHFWCRRHSMFPTSRHASSTSMSSPNPPIHHKSSLQWIHPNHEILSWKCRRHVATCRRRHTVSLQFWPDGSVSPTLFFHVVAVCVGSSRHLLDFSEFVCRNILW